MMSRTLAELIADPDQLEALPPDALPGLLGEVEALRARLWARLQAASVPRVESQAGRSGNGKADRLLSVEDAAERLGVDRRWMYRKADDLPFTRRLSEGTLRFSERGLERWMETR